MATTIDHLRIDHRLTVLRDFTDATGVTLQAGERGVLRALSFDQIRLEIHLGIERENGIVALRFPLKATSGPRLGHMKDFLELGEYIAVPGTERVRPEPPAQTMIVPPPKKEAAPSTAPHRSREAQMSDEADRLEEAEKEILRDIPHLGAASSIAEMYAQRMRAFQAAGNEPRAVAAFKLAVQWMGTYAGWATSGGEGAALSYERDRFHDALVREFGYDPT